MYRPRNPYISSFSTLSPCSPPECQRVMLPWHSHVSSAQARARRLVPHWPFASTLRFQIFLCFAFVGCAADRKTVPKFICRDRSTSKFVRGVLCRTSVFLPCRWPCHAASCFTFRWWRFSSNLLMLLGAVPPVFILGFRSREASQKKCCKAALCML